MTMTIDSSQRHHFGPTTYDHYAGPTQFSNPWTSSTSAQSLYPTSLSNSSLGYDTLPKPQPTSRTALPYSHPSTSATMNHSAYSTVPYGSTDLLSSSQDLLHGQRSGYEPSYTSAPSQTTTTYAPQPSSYVSMGSYGQQLPHQQEQQRRGSQASDGSLHQTSSAYADALNGARVMANMSQSDLTPRNIYAPRSDRGSTDSYGFPSTHSTHSSISSGSGYPQYFAGSVNGDSVTDYSSASESLDGMNSRTLPRPNMMAHSMPPNPQTMMGSFNSKVSSSTQKKHKCKICDKRFTRPSSLQTHMYSHTGEKPFKCEVPGCGRNFSVVSNLRRHRKVHKNEHMSDHGSPEGSWCSRD